VVRPREDRVALLRAQMPDPEAFAALDSWDVDYGDFQASVLLGRENIAGPNGHPDFRWHISVAGRDRVPDWAEFAAIVHTLRPGVTFCMPLPPRSWWINVAENCLHAWELNDEVLEDQWRAERQGHTPT
jgi:hypothetical protein